MGVAGTVEDFADDQIAMLLDLLRPQGNYCKGKVDEFNRDIAALNEQRKRIEEESYRLGETISLLEREQARRANWSQR